jgi:hypothetical protein
MTKFEKELCPHRGLPQHAGYRDTAECKAITKICGQGQNDRRFLLGRLEAMRRYENADQFARWPKSVRNKVRRAQDCLFKAARQVGNYESIRKNLEKEVKHKLGQDGTGLPVAGGYIANLRQLADTAGLLVKSQRAYLFNEAQKHILANVLHRFPTACNAPLALLLSSVLERPINPKNLNEWRKNNRPFIEAVGRTISLF